MTDSRHGASPRRRGVKAQSHGVKVRNHGVRFHFHGMNRHAVPCFPSYAPTLWTSSAGHSPVHPDQTSTKQREKGKRPVPQHRRAMRCRGLAPPQKEKTRRVFWASVSRIRQNFRGKRGNGVWVSGRHKGHRGMTRMKAICPVPPATRRLFAKSRERSRNICVFLQMHTVGCPGLHRRAFIKRETGVSPVQSRCCVSPSSAKPLRQPLRLPLPPPVVRPS